MGGQSPSRNRGHDKAATAAVAIVGLYAIAKFITLAMEPVTPSGTMSVFGYIGLGSVLLAYVVVITRAPSQPRWIFLGILTVVFFAAATSSPHVQRQPNMGYGIAAAAIIFLPLLYMRLRTPKAKTPQQG